MLTFFCGRPASILESLEAPYSVSYMRLTKKGSGVVAMSRWVSLATFEQLLLRAAELSGRDLPSLSANLTNEGWCRGDGEHRTACVVVADDLVHSLASVSSSIATRAAAEWANALGPPVDDFVRGPLQGLAEKLFALFRFCKKDTKVVVMEEGSELPVHVRAEAEPKAEATSGGIGSDMVFLAGDSRQIGEAIADRNDTKLSRAIAGSADFSLNLSMEDLDALHDSAARAHGSQSVRLSDSLGRCVAGDATIPWSEREWSADVLRPEWIEVLSALTDERLEQVTKEWASRFTNGNEKLLREAVNRLAQVCRVATEKRLDVVFSWHC